MQFISPSFLIFLPVVLLVFRLAPVSKRWLVLLFASLFFIGSGSTYTLLALCLFSVLTFCSGIVIARINRNRLVFYVFTILINCASILFLKYIESNRPGLHCVFQEIGFRTDTLLFAVGFTFYTLQHIGYLTDVYYKRIPAELNPLRFLLYAAFFSKFNSGPVEQVQKISLYFKNPILSETNLLVGFQRIVLGFFKKMVLAERLAPIVAQVFDKHIHQGSLTTISGVMLFTVQLYFDFSAYSDIAVGTAKLFGITLTENFQRPFTSTSVSEFWRRWHISLISWFKNYVYFPTVFRLRQSGNRAVLAGITMTFFISGIWHGLGKTFLIWSGLHILYLSYESLTKSKRLVWSKNISKTIYIPLSIISTFACVCFSNLFFRSADFGRAQTLLTQIGSSPFGGKGFQEGVVMQLAGGGYQEALFNFWITLFLTICFLLFEKQILAGLEGKRATFVTLLTLLILIFIFGIFKNAEHFIYLQF